jgi:ABC-type sugar transport system ATPase subunit
MQGLIINHLTKSFDGLVVLDNFNIEVDEGSLLVVLGPSGCGKSTLLRLISGLEVVDSGKIFLDGQDITDLEPQQRKTAMVFQNYALYPHMTVFDNIAFPLKVARMSKAEIKSSVQKTAELLELDQLLERRPAQLSGGQRQRVALGRGLVRQPSIFLLDEPLSNLDAALRLKMREEIVMLQKRLAITMVYVTHDQTEALTMSDRMVVLKDGTIRQHGTPEEIYNNPQDKFVASFIGTPPINLFDDEIINGVGHVLPLRYDNGVKDGKYTIGIRPEHISIIENGSIPGKIISLEYIGAVSYLRVKTEAITVTTTVDSNAEEFAVGQMINLDIDSRRLFLFDYED